MIAMPLDMPVDVPVAQCIEIAAQEFKVPEEILWAIRIVEGGRRGLVRKNSDGSIDVGVMQINSVHFEEFSSKYSVKPSWLVWNNCISVRAGAYRLSKEMTRAKSFWRGVGSYHSRTPSLNRRYVEKIKAALVAHGRTSRSLARYAEQRFEDTLKVSYQPIL